jgi:hypothetical protein
LLAGIADIRQKIFSNAKEILVPFLPGLKLNDVDFKVPVRGEKKKLLESVCQEMQNISDLKRRNNLYLRILNYGRREFLTPFRRTFSFLNLLY